MNNIWILASAFALTTVSGCEPAHQATETSAQRVIAELTDLPTTTTRVVLPSEAAPLLALPGEYAVGVKTINLTNPDQPDITNYDYLKQETAYYDREISIDILYPAADTASGPRATYSGQFLNSDEDPVPDLPDTFTIEGNAYRDAPAQTGQTFPLVIVSHGLGNTPGVLASLTENLVSKGYVVAAIDHGDYILGEPRAPIRLFQRILLFRSIDQRFVLRKLTEMADADSSDWARLIDPTQVALLGFSMGGYGVLNHAGAGYNSEAMTFQMVAGNNLGPLAANAEQFTDETPEQVKAIVAISPWGAQSEVGMWKREAFANISAPLLLIVGSQDDIVGYEDGVRDIFQNAIGADRYMLVFQNAMHNLVQVAAPAIAATDVRLWAAFEDPVWQRQKIHEVNQHFITAFLDLHLKGQDDRRAYLDVPTIASNDGTWPQPMGKDFSTTYANGENGSEGYWQGFKRRQAIGLEMHYLPSSSPENE